MKLVTELYMYIATGIAKACSKYIYYSIYCQNSFY